MRRVLGESSKCATDAPGHLARARRWVTIAGACLASLAALGAAGSTSALGAKTCEAPDYGEYCETASEHKEFQSFAACPFAAAEELDCSWARTSPQERWPAKLREKWEAEHERKAPGLPSEIKAGNVTIMLSKKITLRGGIGFEGENETWFGAQGAPTIEPVPQVATPLGQDVDTALLSPSELSRYNEAIGAGKTKVTATIELAGPASAVRVSAIHLLEEEGTAFAFPVKMKLSNQFFGSECYVGSDGSPIVVEFTTGVSGELEGKAGSRLKSDRNGFIVTVETDTLVNDTFTSPGVSGCGVEGGADEAIDTALGLPSPEGHNFAVLDGTLRLATAQNAKEGLEGKI